MRVFFCRSNIQSLCRYCNIKFDKTDDPFAKFEFTKQKTVNRIIDSGDKVRLQKISMHPVKNAWRDVMFCDQERGLHGATLAEVLHVFQQGLDQYVLDLFMLTKKETKESEKKTET